jgi:hypothetical protein
MSWWQWLLAAGGLGLAIIWLWSTWEQAREIGYRQGWRDALIDNKLRQARAYCGGQGKHTICAREYGHAGRCNY